MMDDDGDDDKVDGGDDVYGDVDGGDDVYGDVDGDGDDDDDDVGDDDDDIYDNDMLMVITLQRTVQERRVCAILCSPRSAAM